MSARFYLAGVEGFEPPNAWTKTMCLTTWRHPNVTEMRFRQLARFWSHGLLFDLLALMRSNSHMPYQLATPQYTLLKSAFVLYHS